MAKKSFYAVKFGYKPGIYQTWADCEAQVKGFKGAVYMSFATLGDAEQFLSASVEQKSVEKEQIDSMDMNIEIEKKIEALQEDEVIAFVDGSYNDDEKKVGFGTILISKGGNKNYSFKSFGQEFCEELVSFRNVAGELEGVKEAIEIASSTNKSKITIYYDYEGIEKWVTGKWKAKKKITQDYASFMLEKMKHITVDFVKVPAHSGIIYNEEADSLAKKSLLVKGHKTYKDGSVYFVGYTNEDWKTIINFINEENQNSLENQNEIIRIAETQFENNKKKLVINDSKNKVIINLYNNVNSYVQGKQSVLFQKVIVTAIEFLSNDQKVVETLNMYHALNVSKEQVEVYFEELLPNYRGNYNDKIYSNLLSATYNMMLTGYMPDYTCLVTPIFRAYEHYLHKILGDKMELSTVDDRGKNKFSYFDKNSKGFYECNSSNTNKLTLNQLNFLNKFYTNYNKVRHPYSHWSADDYDTAMIDKIEVARELLKIGLKLIDEYYTLF